VPRPPAIPRILHLLDRCSGTHGRRQLERACHCCSGSMIARPPFQALAGAHREGHRRRIIHWRSCIRFCNRAGRPSLGGLVALSETNFRNIRLSDGCRSRVLKHGIRRASEPASVVCPSLRTSPPIGAPYYVLHRLNAHCVPPYRIVLPPRHLSASGSHRSTVLILTA
jgi:hypothetical protein